MTEVEAARKTEVFLSVVDWYSVLDHSEIFEQPGDHADEVETSLMMHIAPELVLPLSEAGDGSTNPVRLSAIREGWAWAQREWSKPGPMTCRGAKPRTFRAQ